MAKFIDITGQIFNRLTAIEYIKEKQRWRCRCVCGNESFVNGWKLRTGDIRSCGCLMSDINIARCRKHGGANGGIPEYVTWQAMKRRCDYPKDINYKNYGDRGIKVCDRWINSFENFYADMGKKPTAKHSLDRIKVNEGYSPTNCRWATSKEQNSNRTNNTFYVFLGQRLIRSEWLNRLDMCDTSFINKIKKYPFEEIAQKYLKEEYRNLIF